MIVVHACRVVPLVDLSVIGYEYLGSRACVVAGPDLIRDIASSPTLETIHEAASHASVNRRLPDSNAKRSVPGALDAVGAPRVGSELPRYPVSADASALARRRARARLR